LLDADSSDEGEYSLDQGAREEPAARMGAYPIADAAGEGTEVKSDEGNEGLLIRNGEDDLVGIPRKRERKLRAPINTIGLIQ
jgi:hypothetical protein